MMYNELLNEIRTATAPHVFRALNAETGINWEKPFDVQKLTGNYTTRKIEKEAAAAGYDSRKDLIILFTRDTANRWNNDFHMLTIEAGTANIDHDNRGSASIYTNGSEYKSAPFRTYFRKADFEADRKAATAETIIIMQAAENVGKPGRKHTAKINGEDRYKLIEAKRYGDGAGNTYTGAIVIQSTTDNGSRATYTANPAGFYNARRAWKPESAAEMIDKSGYLLRARREELKARAAKLRAEKAAKAYQETDDSQKVKELAGMIDELKAAIVTRITAAKTYEEMKATSAMIDNYNTGLKWIMYSFEMYRAKVEAKTFCSIAAAEKAYTDIKSSIATAAATANA